MEPMAKKLLKASLGLYNLQYMKVETECVVATNESILTIVFDSSGFNARAGIYSKDFDKIDVESDYEFPNWIEAMPKVDPNSSCFLRSLNDLVCFLGSKGLTYDIDIIKSLPNQTEMNILLYDHSVMIYYPELETISIIKTIDVGQNLGIGSSFKGHKEIVTDIEKRQRKRFDDEDYQLELFTDHKAE